MPKFPSESQIKAQVRRAERQMQSAVDKAARQWEADVNREARKIDRQNEATWKKAVSEMEATANREARKVQRRSRPVVTYTPTERHYLDTVQSSVEQLEERHDDFRDVFLCHAWRDRGDAAQELHDALEAYGVDVWFSEKDVDLGVPLTRELDRGLKSSKTGLVLVTPAMLISLRSQGIADKELSALLATDRVIPVVHETTFDQLRDESPLLASRSGLSTEDSSLDEVAAKISETLKKPAR